MLWIYLTGALLFGTLFYASYEEAVPEEACKLWLEIPFYRMASYLANRVSGKRKKNQEKEIEKWKLALILLFLGCLFLPVLDYATATKEQPLKEYQLERPEKGDGETSYQIQGTSDALSEPVDIVVPMKERSYTNAEKESLLEQAKQEIDDVVLGDNESADDVRDHIVLPDSLQDGRVHVQWLQEPQGLVDETGVISAELPEGGTILILRALMTCEGTEQTYEFALHLNPLLRTEEEELAYQLRKAVEEAAESSEEESIMVLPRQVGGKQVSFLIPGKHMTGVCLLGVIGLSVIGYVGKEQEYRQAEEERKRQLLLDYPDVVFKLGMLLNAGLTIQNAFTRIAEEYGRHKKNTSRFAYEEMLCACYEMKSGIPEAKAYEQFGRRCGENCYVRLGSMLSGGLQKSAEGLTTLLLREAEQAMEDRRLLARKLGEEAGTRLLFPMILMLLVVMVILMVPAMLSF